MLELHQREDCPYSTKVRRFLEDHHLSYKAVPEPKLGSERQAVLTAAGIETPEVPLLVDDDAVVQGSDKIISYLRENYVRDYFGDPSYGLTRTLPGLSYEQAVDAAKEALAGEGFGVLTEIDVRATMKKKLDVEHPPYTILGACNPPLAHRALSGEPGIGLLLPCNVVVTQEADGTAVVSTIDPVKMFSVVKMPELEPVAEEVRGMLKRVLAALPAD